jgi:methionyl aminopeptidase
MMNKNDLKKIRKAAKITTEIMSQVKGKLSPGITGYDVDELIGELCESREVKPAFKGVQGSKEPYPSNLCFQINSETLHTVPKKDQVVKDGDLVSVDFGIIYDGMYTDNCVTFGIGELNQEDKKLLETGRLAVLTAAKQVKPGITTGDLGYTMSSITDIAGFDVLKNYVGHGIGDSLHLPPEIPAYGHKGNGARLRRGQVVCVEAQVVAGRDQIKIAGNGWDILTADGENSVMFEYMVEVTNSGFNILTETQEWDLII